MGYVDHQVPACVFCTSWVRMVTSHEIEARRTAVANAIATQRLAGLEIDAQTLADMDRYAQGEINLPEALAQLRQRVAASELAEAVQDFEDYT